MSSAETDAKAAAQLYFDKNKEAVKNEIRVIFGALPDDGTVSTNTLPALYEKLGAEKNGFIPVQGWFPWSP
jgi:hypothetical protein